MLRYLLIFILGLNLVACGNSGEANINDISDMEDSLETISRGTMGSPVMLPSENNGEVIITDQERFSELWKQMHQGIGNDYDEAPEIDFSNFMVVGVFMGEMPSSGYSIRINEVAAADESLKVHVSRTEPGPNCMNLTVITYPHHIVKIPATDKSVEFEYSTFVEDCE